MVTVYVCSYATHVTVNTLAQGTYCAIEQPLSSPSLARSCGGTCEIVSYNFCLFLGGLRGKFPRVAVKYTSITPSKTQ